MDQGELIQELIEERREWRPEIEALEEKVEHLEQDVEFYMDEINSLIEQMDEMRDNI